MTEQDRLSYEDDAEAVFLPGTYDDKMRDWVGPPQSYQPGRSGLCWHNARELAGSSPETLLYAEGLVSIGDEERVPHGWVVRKADGSVIECTAGYRSAKSYRGICFEVAEVEAFIDGTGPGRDVSRRERWRKSNDDGSVRSEAPGVFWMLAEERLAHTDVEELFAVWKYWVRNGKCAP